jgi:hypothetical protein
VTVPPWLALSLLVTLTVALLYQVASRRWGWRVIGYWALVAAGWLIAEAVAESLGWNFSRFGDLRLIPDTAGAVTAVLILWFLGI